MLKLIRTIVSDYGWIHMGLGLLGNALFLAGSVMFLPGFGQIQLAWMAQPMEWKTIGVWLFIAGAALMLVGSFGNMVLSLFRAVRESE